MGDLRQIVPKSEPEEDAMVLCEYSCEEGTRKENCAKNIYHLDFSQIIKSNESESQTITTSFGISECVGVTFLLEKELVKAQAEIDSLKRALSERNGEINSLLTRIGALEKDLRHCSIRERASAPGKLRSQVNSLEKCLDVLIWKLYRQGSAGGGGLGVSANEDVVAFQQEVMSLFCQVNDKLKKWEMRQRDISLEVQWTRGMLLKLNGILDKKIRLPPSKMTTGQRQQVSVLPSLAMKQKALCGNGGKNTMLASLRSLQYILGLKLHISSAHIGK